MSRRDPQQTFADGDPFFESLLAKNPPFSCASVNYRLSPDVQHPAHQLDVIASLKFLKQEYGMDEFILIGHSAGACLAFQSAEHVSTCRAIIGIEGIYDLRDLVQEYPNYEDFVESAFGKDKGLWATASPIHIATRWSNCSDVVVQLIQSMEDELLGPRQAEQMFSILQQHSVNLQEIGWIHGTHDSSIASSECHAIIHTLISRLFKTRAS
jgi:kynurenine formamidase